MQVRQATTPTGGCDHFLAAAKLHGEFYLLVPVHGNAVEPRIQHGARLLVARVGRARYTQAKRNERHSVRDDNAPMIADCSAGLTMSAFMHHSGASMRRFNSERVNAFMHHQLAATAIVACTPSPSSQAVADTSPKSSQSLQTRRAAASSLRARAVAAHEGRPPSSH